MLQLYVKTKVSSSIINKLATRCFARSVDVHTTLLQDLYQYRYMLLIWFIKSIYVTLGRKIFFRILIRWMTQRMELLKLRFQVLWIYVLLYKTKAYKFWVIWQSSVAVLYISMQCMHYLQVNCTKIYYIIGIVE